MAGLCGFFFPPIFTYLLQPSFLSRFSPNHIPPLPSPFLHRTSLFPPQHFPQPSPLTGKAEVIFSGFFPQRQVGHAKIRDLRSSSDSFLCCYFSLSDLDPDLRDVLHVFMTHFSAVFCFTFQLCDILFILMSLFRIPIAKSFSCTFLSISISLYCQTYFFRYLLFIYFSF